MKFSTYNEYYSIENDFVSKLPKDWALRKLKYEVDFLEGLGLLATEFQNEGTPLIRISGVKNNFVSLKGCNYVSTDKVNSNWKKQRLKTGDLVISCSASTDFISEVNEVAEGSVCYTGLIRLRPKRNTILKEFVKYIIASNFYTSQIDVQKTGSTIQHYGPTHLNRMFFIVPPVKEQQSIAIFLNKETLRIDALIDKKEKLIESLKEKRIAVISHAVTKGLNTDVQLKSSEIDWLQEIPKNWTEKALKYICTINDKTLPETTDPEYEINYVDIGSIDKTIGIVKKEKHLFDEAPSRARRIVQEGDILVSTVRTYLRAIAPVTDPEDNLIVSTGFAVVRPRKIDSGYLSFLLRSKYFVEKVVSLSVGVSYPAINASVLASIKIPIPPHEEQKEISKYLKQETESIDKIVGLTEKHIDKLQEYKTALISAAVTGKIKVPEQS